MMSSDLGEYKTEPVLIMMITENHSAQGCIPMNKTRWAVSIILSTLLLSVLACGSPRLEPTSTHAVSPTQTATPETTTPPIPEEYQVLHHSLSQHLNHFQETLALRWNGEPGSTVFGAELIIANGNRGEVLLLPETMQAVRLYLDRLQEVGVGGVTVQISDPLLSPEYPRAAEYLDFFREVAEEVHSRGLKLLVEAGPVFADPQYSKVSFDWSSLTLDQFFQMRRDQLVLIAREVQPDYLSLGNEPGTQIMLTGLTFSLDQYLDFVRDTAASIDRSSGVLLGAGSGNWEDPAYLERLSDEPALDFVNIHIYPLSSTYVDFMMRALGAAEVAHAKDKQVIVGETWLFKASAQEVSQLIPYQDVYARDMYSFWQPLDIRFLEAMVSLAHYEQFEYVSFFWSGFFFGYLDYDSTPENLLAVDLYQRLNTVQFGNILAGVLSETGKAYQALLGQAPPP
jgi:hypothetical protein